MLPTVLAAVSVYAQSEVTYTETQHAVELDVPLTPKLDVTLHGRIRTHPGVLGVYQVRTGPVLNYAVVPRFSVLGGYYFSAQKSAEDEVWGRHRPFGGVEITLLQTNALKLEGRSLFERFLGSGSDFNRVRNRLRVEARGKVAPYAGGEWFADARGSRGMRYSGGVRWEAGEQFEMDIGYFYEARRPDAGHNRHMFLTSFHFRFPAERRPDPDI